MPESPGTTQLRIAREATAAAKYAEELKLVRELVGDFKGVIIEIIRASLSNPLMGAIVGISIMNIGERLGVIDHGTAILGDGIITAAFGVQAGSDVIEAITQITHVGGGTPPSDLVKPSAQVVVISGGGEIKELTPEISGALLARVAQLKNVPGSA